MKVFLAVVDTQGRLASFTAPKDIKLFEADFADEELTLFYLQAQSVYRRRVIRLEETGVAKVKGADNRDGPLAAARETMKANASEPVSTRTSSRE